MKNKRSKADFTVGNIYIYINFTNISEGTEIKNKVQYGTIIIITRENLNEKKVNVGNKNR